MNKILDIIEHLFSFFGKTSLFVLCTLYSVLLSSQSFPVQVIPQAVPPAPIYLSDYADASTVNSPLRVQIILNDFEIANREIKLRTYFQGNGIAFQSNDMVVGANPLFLEGGIPLILTNVELAPYFRFENIIGIGPNVYGQPIPEGAYQFCFEVFDVLTGNRLSYKSCATTVVFQNEPPFLVLPRNKINVDEINPQNIVFQWTPRSINVTNVEYELSLVEIWDTQVDPQAAFLSSPPVFQTTTSATTYVYGPADPLLLSGKNYAWRVQAKAKQGIEEIGLFKNQGYSEIFSFSYAGSCDLPLSIAHEVKGSTNANIFWDDFSTEIPEYRVRYRQKGNNNEWFLTKTTTNQLTLWDLKAGTRYEYQIQKKCTVTQSDWSITKEFTTFIADNEDSVYECGITPDFGVTNKEPLPSISVGKAFVAGDFPIKILEVTGSNGRFTGKGYVTIPYLNSIKVGVEFTNVLLNTDKQLVEGSVITIYDPSLSNILDIDEAIDTVSDVVDAVVDIGESVGDILKDVFGDDNEDEENAPPMEPEGTEGESSNTSSDSSNENSENSSTDNTSTSEGNASGGNATDSTNSGGDQNASGTADAGSGTDTGSETSTTTGSEVVIVYNGTGYKNNEIIEVPYDKNNSNYAFLLKNYPEDATFNWQVLKLGTDNTAAHVTNEPIHDNLGVDMKKVYILDVVANYNNQKIKVTIKRELKDFDLVDIYAKPEDSPKRIAKTGQKLYLKKSSTSFVNAERKVDFSVHIDDNLSQGDISQNNIKWYYELPDTQYSLGKNYGKKDIHLTLAEQESTYSVNVKAGKPELIEKGIDVVWFNEDYSKNGHIFKGGFDLMPHLKELAKKVGVPVYHEEGKYASDTGFSILANTNYLTESKNLEDSESRLVYNETQQKFSLLVGLKGKFEKGIPYLSLPQVKKTYLGVDFEFSMGVFFFMEASISGEIGHTKFTEDWVEEKETRNKTYLKIGNPSQISLNTKIGLDPKLVIKASENISGTISGAAFAEAELFRADFANETYSFPLIEEGFALKFKPTISFTFFEWGYTYLIDEKVYNVKW